MPTGGPAVNVSFYVCKYLKGVVKMLFLIMVSRACAILYYRS